MKEKMKEEEKEVEEDEENDEMRGLIGPKNEKNVLKKEEISQYRRERTTRSIIRMRRQRRLQEQDEK